MAVGVFDGGLGFAEAAEAGERGAVAGGKGLMKVGQNLFASGEEGVARVGDGPDGLEGLFSFQGRQGRDGFAGEHGLHRAERGLNDCRLFGQTPVEVFVAFIKVVAGGAFEGAANEMGVIRSEGDGDEFRIPALGFVEFLGDDVAFPGCSFSDVRNFFAVEALEVSLVADD